MDWLFFQTSHFKIFLGVLAGRAGFGRFFTFMNITAVAALPINLVFAFKVRLG
jgi:hypothetical protein